MSTDIGRLPMKIGFVTFCWSVLVLHFILSGFVRGFVLPQFSNYLFFVPLPAIICAFIVSLSIDSKIRFFDFFCISIALLLLLYQVVLVLGGSINLQTALYGWFLYGLPFLGVIAAQKSFNPKILERITNLFEICLIPNVFFAIMQTIVRNSQYFSAGFGEGLQSVSGVQRATGTFSSPAGYALYLTLTASFLLMRNDMQQISVHRNLISFGLLLFQIPISGSRTAIMSVSLVFLAKFVFRKRARISQANKVQSHIWILIASVTVVGAFWKFSSSPTVQATSARFVSANEVDPPLRRLLAQLKVDLQDIGFLHGTGLGSRANGTTVLGVNWVEFDVQRVFIEAGFVIGVILLGFRFFLVLRILENYRKKNHAFEAPLIAAVVPILLFGQFMGQGSISTGTWLGLYILEYLRPKTLLLDQYGTKLS